MDQQFINQNTCIKVESSNPSTLEFRQSASQAVDVKVLASYAVDVKAMVISLQSSLLRY